jgi:hypothetical protein
VSFSLQDLTAFPSASQCHKKPGLAVPPKNYSAFLTKKDIACRKTFYPQISQIPQMNSPQRHRGRREDPKPQAHTDGQPQNLHPQISSPISDIRHPKSDITAKAAKNAKNT